MIDVKFRQEFKEIISLEQLRTVPKLEGMALLQKGSRLSIQPVTKAHWNTIVKMST